MTALTTHKGLRSGAVNDVPTRGLVGYNGNVNSEELEKTLERMFDDALLYHAFTDYARDYEVIVYMSPGSGPKIPSTHLSLPFQVLRRRPDRVHSRHGGLAALVG